MCQSTNSCGLLIVDTWSVYFGVATSPCHRFKTSAFLLVEKTLKDERRSSALLHNQASNKLKE
jgi:hypothetical protein